MRSLIVLAYFVLSYTTGVSANIHVGCEIVQVYNSSVAHKLCSRVHVSAICSDCTYVQLLNLRHVHVYNSLLVDPVRSEEQMSAIFMDCTQVPLTSMEAICTSVQFTGNVLILFLGTHASHLLGMYLQTTLKLGDVRLRKSLIAHTVLWYNFEPSQLIVPRYV